MGEKDWRERASSSYFLLWVLNGYFVEKDLISYEKVVGNA